jgi:hypothetical protein
MNRNGEWALARSSVKPHLRHVVSRRWSSCPAHVCTYLRHICCRAKEVLKLIKIDDTRNLGK